MNTEQNNSIPPWYRQFWPWFLIALPGSVVVASMVTIFLAIKSPVQLVAEDYYRQGLAVNRVIAQDNAALEKGISAAMTFDWEVGELLITLEGASPEFLTLHLYHPSEVERDLKFTMTPVAANNYRTDLPNRLNDRRYVRLYPGDITDDKNAPQAPWRLNGDVNLRLVNQVSLTPQ